MAWSVVLSLYYVLLARDRASAIHCRNVAKYSYNLGCSLGLSSKEMKELYVAALLHDCGKIGLPDRLLKTTRKYTRWEKQIVQQHVVIGRNLLSSLGFSKDVIDGVYYHHERYDGLGYKMGLQGNNIPLYGRIIAIADAFDALTSKRPYREPMPVIEAIQILNNSKGQFDLELLKIFFHDVVEKYMKQQCS
ncbi:MAG: HD-GYP domain-containing protein [Thermovenabulum sp.]|uniref:HD-GYP domain-containing protein n=1 Tax=Thermovenabulum sp. TaxID=3100335 RepID=UPI003C79C4C7